MPKIKLLISVLNIPRFIFHIICFLRYYSICESDIIVGIEHRKYKCSVFIGFIYLLTFDSFFRNLFYKRIGNLKYFIQFLAPSHNSFFINTHMYVGKSFLCIHPFGTYVNAKSVGDNFTIRNNVTIGDKNGCTPIIGNNVTVNVNSVVVGNIKIGNNVVIGACSLIMKDVPDNCVVAGNPAYIIRREGVPCKEKL